MRGIRGVIAAMAAIVIAATAAACAHAPGPLHKAAFAGDADFVRTWIAQKRDLDVTYDEPEHGLEGNYARSRGVTALMVAAKLRHFEIVKLLADGGANLYAESRNRDGSNPRTAFDYAVEGGSAEIVEYLWTRSDRVRFASRLDRHIVSACFQRCEDTPVGDPRSKLALFLIGVAPDDKRGKGISEAACYGAHPREVLAFLDRHAVRFPKNTLHCAAYQDTVRGLRSPQERMAIVSFFLDRGADPNDLSTGGITPLIGAAAAHDVEMVKLLLARGANPHARSSSGRTAAVVAADTCIYGGTAADIEPRQQRELAVIETLIQAGVDVRALSKEERSQFSILTTCCSRTPHTATQRRICELYGM
jgi:ankyrin repeat protein